MVNLAPLWLRGSTTALVDDPAATSGLKGFIIEGTYQVALGSPGEILLTGVSASSFFPHLLFDYSRFAMAARESVAMSFSKPFDKRALGWAMINRYYASFFAGHALLRAHARGVTWLDGAEANQIERAGKLYVGPTFSMKKGGYAFEFDFSQPYNSILKLSPVSFGGGSHDDFWRYFLRYLGSYGSTLLSNGAQDAQQAIARIAELDKIILATSLRGVWLSSMRNEINYNQSFGLWFPFKPTMTDELHQASILKRSNDFADLNLNVSKSPLKAFSAATCFLATLNSDIANLIKERAGSGAQRFRNEWNRLESRLAS